MKTRLTFICMIIAFSAASADTPGLRFAPHWLPQAQFAGFYMAHEQGYYRDAGLEVEIVHPPAHVNVIDWLKEGHTDVISQFLVSAITARDQGTDLVNIAQFSQHSAILFVSKKSSGIETLEDFNGKSIAVWRGGFSEVPMAMLSHHGLEVEWVPILTSVNLFLLGGVDIMTVMWYNEINQIYLSGINRDELNTFFLSDYSFDVPEDGLYTMRETREAKGEELKAFVAATRKGWEYAANHRDETVERVVRIMREAHIPSNPAHQRWMLDKVLATHEAGDKQIGPGELHPADFRMAVDILQDRGMIQGEGFSYEDFFVPVLPMHE